MTAEEWRPVVGFPAYFVSDQGRVRSTHLWRGQRNRILVGHTASRGGYPCVQLIAPEGGVKARSVHVLVAEAFLGPRPAGQEVRHLDGDAKNPALSNLTYGSHGDNERDKRRHGTHPKASRANCIHGHPLDRLRPDGVGRRCSTCRRESSRRQRARAAA